MWETEFQVVKHAAPKEAASFRDFAAKLRALMEVHIKERYTAEQLEEMAERSPPEMAKRYRFLAICIRKGIKHAIASIDNIDPKSRQSWGYDLIRAYNIAGVRGLTNPSGTLTAFNKTKTPANEIWGVRQIVRYGVPNVAIFLDQIDKIANKYPPAADDLAELRKAVQWIFQGAVASAGLIFDDEIALQASESATQLERLEARLSETTAASSIDSPGEAVERE